MNIQRKIITAILAIGAVLMTTPTFNAADLDLPAAIANVPESPTITRTGTVISITEADNIVVRISGSNVLVRASYLFPQYSPVLGDRVIVIKQDAQWLVLGTASGELNTGILNASFEEGTTGALPDDWAFATVSGAGGAITFQKQTGSYLGQPISGNFVGAVDFTSNGVIAVSSANIASTRIQANPDEQWAAAIWIPGGIMSNGTISLQEMFMEFYDADVVLLASNSVAQWTLGGTTLPRTYIRPFATTPSFTAPANTALVRMRLNVQFAMTPATLGTVSTVFYDYAILRKVT